MPVMNRNLDVNVHISVSAHFLKNTRALELLRDRYDFNSPGLRFKGMTTRRDIDTNGKVVFDVLLDDFPEVNFMLLGTSLRYDGPRDNQKRMPATAASSITDTIIDEEGGGLEDAEATEDENLSDVEAPENNTEWIVGEVSTNQRLVSGINYHTMKSSFKLRNKSTATPADYFLYFLPTEFIKDVIIPNINTHASNISVNWVGLTYLEYLTWIALFMNMTVFFTC